LQAISEIRRQKRVEVKTYDDGLRHQYDDRLLNELQQLRMQTDQEMQAIRDEIAGQYEKKIEDLQTTIRRNADQFGSYRSDVTSYRERIEDVTKTRDALNDKVLYLEQRCRDLEDRLHRSQQKQDESLAEREDDLQRLKQQIEQMQIDYQNLLDIKIGLDREIATYRKLLESEEER
jgi:chromosome segregation ATPase